MRWYRIIRAIPYLDRNPNDAVRHYQTRNRQIGNLIMTVEIGKLEWYEHVIKANFPLPSYMNGIENTILQSTRLSEDKQKKKLVTCRVTMKDTI